MSDASKQSAHAENQQPFYGQGEMTYADHWAARGLFAQERGAGAGARRVRADLALVSVAAIVILGTLGTNVDNIVSSVANAF
jgi:hypothetical protein